MRVGEVDQPDHVQEGREELKVLDALGHVVQVQARQESHQNANDFLGVLFHERPREGAQRGDARRETVRFRERVRGQPELLQQRRDDDLRAE